MPSKASTAGGAKRESATQAERTATARDALIRATVSVLADEGYRAATVARIQDVSGLSRGLVGYHFGSKEKLIKAVVDYIRVNFGERNTAHFAHGGMTGIEQVLELFESYLTRALDDPTAAKAMLVLAIESSTEDSDVRRAVQDHFQHTCKQIEDMLDTGIRDGSVRPDADSHGRAAVVHGMIRGIMLQFMLDPAGFDLARSRDDALGMLRTDLSGKA